MPFSQEMFNRLTAWCCPDGDAGMASTRAGAILLGASLAFRYPEYAQALVQITGDPPGLGLSTEQMTDLLVEDVPLEVANGLPD